MDDPAWRGLTADEVELRRSDGRANDVGEVPSRTVADILRANVLTRFNAILGSLLAVIIVIGPFQDGLFGVVLVANALIGIVQELRAKRTLDKLALLSAPHAHARRDGVTVELSLRDLVADDLLALSPGDQVPLDGEVLSGSMELNEALLTGEADPVAKTPGSTVLSGSFVVAGSGWYRVTRVGRESYAQAIAEEARRFTLATSELQAGLNRILRIVQWLMIPTAVLLVANQLRTTSVTEALRGSVAGLGAMVPEGLVLLTSVAFALAVIRLARRRVLVQELPAVEGLARVDVVCLDKTGTLTEGTMVLSGIDVLDGTAPVPEALAALVASDPTPNPSMQAIAATYPAPPAWDRTATVPFSSARKWSGATYAELDSAEGPDGSGSTTWILGAPDVVAPGLGDDERARAEQAASGGSRVLLLARSPRALEGDTLPAAIDPVALVVLDEQERADAADTLAYFASQHVAVKVISGDHPATVGAIARRLGIAGADQPVDARRLVDHPDQLAALANERSVFGRVSPQQKRELVAALQAAGHTVAMTGDGVNDVLALKDADIGVAMGSGSSAARSVAQLVLLDDSFAALPPVIAEGRRVIGNVERVATLFLTKTVYAMILSVGVGLAALPFPFLPRHLTIVSTVTIGVPAFFLALAPNNTPFRKGFVGRVVRFAAPFGTVAALATLAAYEISGTRPGLTLNQVRTTATCVLVIVGLWVLSLLARPFTRWRQLLVGSMIALFLLIVGIPGLRDFYALQLPSFTMSVVALGIAAAAGLALEGGWWALGEWRAGRFAVRLPGPLAKLVRAPQLQKAQDVHEASKVNAK